jgi:hypothetical protein
MRNLVTPVVHFVCIGNYETVRSASERGASKTEWNTEGAYLSTKQPEYDFIRAGDVREEVHRDIRRVDVHFR